LWFGGLGRGGGGWGLGGGGWGVGVGADRSLQNFGSGACRKRRSVSFMFLTVSSTFSSLFQPPRTSPAFFNTPDTNLSLPPPLAAFGKTPLQGVSLASCFGAGLVFVPPVNQVSKFPIKLISFTTQKRLLGHSLQGRVFFFFFFFFCFSFFFFFFVFNVSPLNLPWSSGIR